MVLLYCYIALAALIWGTGIVLYHGFTATLTFFLPCTFVVALLPWYIKHTGRVRLASHAVIVTTLVCVFGVNMMTGGTGSGTLIWGLYIPALAAIMISPAAGLGYSLLSLLPIGVVYYIEAFDIEPILALGNDYAFMDMMRNAPAAMIALTGLAVAHEVQLRQTLAQLKETEEQLRGSERRYRAVSNLTSDFAYYIRFGPDGGLQPEWITEAISKVTGLTPEQSLSRMEDSIHEDDRPVFEGRIKRLMNGEDSKDEYRVVDTEGQVRWLSTQGRPDFRDNKVVGYYGAARDITLEKQQSEQLEHAQKMDALGQLTGGVAHDFNNLLTVIRGNLDLMEEQEVLEGRGRRLLEEAIAATRSGADLINSLLMFSRQRPLRPRPIPVGAHIQQQLGLVDRAVGATVSLSLSVISEDPVVSVDPSQLDRVILNLALNAKDAMTRGGSVRIEIDRGEPPPQLSALQGEEYAHICVSDDGAGMPDDVLNNAVQPFYTTKGPGEGTGMGLSMVYGFARQAGGDMLIDSRVGEGTQVSLYLPLVKEAASIAPQRQRGVPIQRAENEEHILIVDDEPSLRLLCTEALSSLGYQVTTAGDAAEAREVLRGSARIDLMFTDWVMPGDEDGYQLAKWASTRHPDMAIVMTTGFAEAREDATLQQQAFPTLDKPYSLPDLASCINENLRRNAQSSDGA